MFPKLEKKFVFLYTLSTGLILTLILAAAFLFYLSSQSSRQNSVFQDHLFTLLSKLQTDSLFSDSYLAQLENKNHLAIYIEENGSPFFFPGSYKTRTERRRLFERTETLAEAEGIFPDSHPISSNLLQSSILRIKGDQRDTYLGNILIIQASNGYKKLILLQDISGDRRQVLKTFLFYLLIDGIGISLLFLAGRWFVRRSLKPLEETYKKQQDFVAAASHELRSPLAVIQTTADAMSDAMASTNITLSADAMASADTMATEAGGHLLSVIKKECQRGSSLVKNLLLLATADRDQWAVSKKYFELDEMLLNLLEVYEPLCLSKDGRILLELPDEPMPAVLADPDLCRQIFTILLDNAVSYGLEDRAACGLEDTADLEIVDINRRDRKIVLRAQCSHSYVTVFVADHGPGISDEEKGRIFDRFYRKDSSRNQKEHFGLGLSIAAKLAEIQGIGLEVEDTEGGGSTFRVEIRK